MVALCCGGIEQWRKDCGNRKASPQSSMSISPAMDAASRMGHADQELHQMLRTERYLWPCRFPLIKSYRMLLFRTERPCRIREPASNSSLIRYDACMDEIAPLKKSEGESFHLRQLDDDGKPFAVAAHLDVRGLTCPMPALKSLEHSQQLVSGQVLEVVGDWPGSKFEVPFAVTGKAHLEVVRIIESDVPEDETWWIYVRR